MDRLTRCVLRSVDAAPCSDRALAQRAGISPTLITLMRTGERRATQDVAQTIVSALAGWSVQCRDAARELLGELRKDYGTADDIWEENLPPDMRDR